MSDRSQFRRKEAVGQYHISSRSPPLLLDSRRRSRAQEAQLEGGWAEKRGAAQASSLLA